MIYLEDGTPEYEISDSICNSISDEITRIKAMSDDEVCKNYQVDYKNEALIATVEFYHTGTGMTYDDYIDELTYRNVIDFDPEALQNEIDTREENEATKKKIAEIETDIRMRRGYVKELPPAVEQRIPQAKLEQVNAEWEEVDSVLTVIKKVS